MFVHVVGENPDMGMPEQDLCEGFEFGLGIGGAGGIGRRIQDHPFRPRRDGLFQVGRLQLVDVLRPRRDDDSRSAAERHDFRIGHPIGRGNDDFVAGIEAGHQGVEQDLLAARADDAVGGAVVEPVLALEFLRDGLAQRQDAGDRAIFGLAAPDRLDRRVLDIVWRVEIRLSHREVDDLASLRPATPAPFA